MSGGWYFREMDDKAEQNADLLTKHAFENDVATFVRETLQNANDARVRDSEDPVRVSYRFDRLSGQELDSFLDNLDWAAEDGDVGLYDHLRAAGEVEDDRQLEEYLDHVENERELLLLTVEDRNTQGLDGSETEDGTNYTALIRDMGRSNKSAGEGGSHGVGKTVLWAFSGTSTVLFNSYPTRNTAGNDPPRFVGRTLLPDHRDDETEQLYSGNGWYGRVDPDDPNGRYVSMWGDDASGQAETLRAEHRTGPMETGTAATVVGFRDPTSEGYPDLDELWETFRSEVARYFWPAIENGDLEVSLERADGTTEQVEPSDVDVVAPFVKCFEERETPDDDLESRGNVVGGGIEFDLPNKKAGEDRETEPRGYLDVYAKKPSPGDDEHHLNEVAIFRGAGMVVEYVSMSGAASYGSDFYGLLMAGEARGWLGETSVADPDVEELLRTSEPAAHDEWKGYKNSRLQSTYERGCATAVHELTRSKLKQCLQNLVASDAGKEGGMIDSMKRKIPKADRGSSTSKSGGISISSPEAFDLGLDFDYSGGRWTFDGTIQPEADDVESWTATLSIVTLGEENNETGGLDIELASLESGTAETRLEDGRFVVEVEGSPEPVGVEGQSASFGGVDPYSGRLGKSRLQLEGDVVLGGES